MFHDTHRGLSLLVFAAALLVVPAAVGAAAAPADSGANATPAAPMSEIGLGQESEIQLQTACTDNSDCASDEFCFKEGFRCGGQGTCELKPEACILVFDPVCGCDGQTYSNACIAHSNGVNVASEGECE